MSRTRKKILDMLPATPREIALELYGEADMSAMAAVYVHINLLRRKVKIESVRREKDIHDPDRSIITYKV